MKNEHVHNKTIQKWKIAFKIWGDAIWVRPVKLASRATPCVTPINTVHSTCTIHRSFSFKRWDHSLLIYSHTDATPSCECSSEVIRYTQHDWRREYYVLKRSYLISCFFVPGECRSATFCISTAVIPLYLYCIPFSIRVQLYIHFR